MSVTVYLTKIEGRFHAKYQKPDGNWTTKSLSTKKKAKAKIELGKFAQKLALMRVQPVESRGNQTIQQLVADFTHFIKDNRSEGWAGIQRLYLKRILEFFGPETPVVDITTKRIEEYASWRRTAVRGTTVNKELSTLRTMFDKAVDWKFIEASPARSVKELPDDSAIHDRYLKPNEFETLLAQSIAQRESGLPVVGLMFQDFPEFISVGVHTGLRLTEMLMLEFHDIDFENEILSVKKKPHLKFFVKNYQERHIRLNSEALVALLSLRQRKSPKSDFVFQAPSGGYWKPHVRRLQSQFSDLVKAAGLHHTEPSKNVTIHTLRHTFGSWLALKGVPLRRIQYLMGHNSITTTERYAHLVQEEAYEDTRALEKMSSPFLLGSLLGGLDEQPVSCYAEKRTRTSTPLRGLEPESSASANSAISATEMNLCSSIIEVNRLEP